MKLQLILLFTFIFTYSSNAQHTVKIDFAGNSIQLTEDCNKKSDTHFICNKISTQWNYLDESTKPIGENILAGIKQDLERKDEILNVQSIKIKFFNDDLMGNKFIFKEGMSLIIIWGIVNDRSLLIYISSPTEIKSNKDFNSVQSTFMSIVN